LNEDSKLLHNPVRYPTHICDCLKNAPPVVEHNNYESLPDSDGIDNLENPGLAKDWSEPSSYPLKRHAMLRSYNRPAQENNKPYKPHLTTSERKVKSTSVNNANGDSMVQKSKDVFLKKNVINSQKVAYHEPLHHTVPLLQKGNLIGKNSKHLLLQLNLQDTTTQIKSLTSAPQYKLGEIISDKLVDGSLHNKLSQPSLTLPIPYKHIKYPAINPLVRATETHNNVDTAGFITADSNKQSNPLKLSPLSPHILNNEKDLITENKPFLLLPSINLNKPKLVGISYDRSVLPIAYRPTRSQLIQTPPVFEPIHQLPILVQKEVSISPKDEQPQVNIGSSSQYPKVIKNVIAESTSQPILIEKAVSIPLSPKKQLKSIDSPTTQCIKTSRTEIAHKRIKIEKAVSLSALNEQKNR